MTCDGVVVLVVAVLSVLPIFFVAWGGAGPCILFCLYIGPSDIWAGAAERQAMLLWHLRARLGADLSECQDSQYARHQAPHTGHWGPTGGKGQPVRWLWGRSVRGRTPPTPWVREAVSDPSQQQYSNRPGSRAGP